MPSPIKPPRLTLIVALLGASALTACAEVGPNFTRPSTPNVAGYAMKGDEASTRIVDAAASQQQGGWWKAFKVARTRRHRPASRWRTIRPSTKPTRRCAS